MFAEAWNYLAAHPEQFGRALGVHVALSASALLIAALIAIPVAVAVARRPGASLVAVNLSNIGRTLPSLAILALAMPLLLVGAIPVTLLSLGTDALFGHVQRRFSVHRGT